MKKVYRFPAIMNFEDTAKFINGFELNKKNKEILFDLKNISFMYSSFIGFLVDLKNKCEKLNIKFSINASNYVKKLLKEKKWLDFFKDNL